MGRTSYAKYDGDRGSRAGCRRKSVMFFLFFLSRFGITKSVITETIWSSVTFKTIIVSLHRVRFVVAHLFYSTFSGNLRNFRIGVNLYQKLRLFAILGAVGPHFKNQSSEIWYKGADLGLPPQPKYCKNRWKGYTHFGQIYTKNYQFQQSVSPNFKSDNLARGCRPGIRSPTPNYIEIA